ncbi:MAG: dockerin type I domain-containing protein [Clostridia bacterium]|nr:dockerin type I domain-containing protein [Clostridia bacterium]
MDFKKILSSAVATAMLLTSMSFNVLADVENTVNVTTTEELQSAVANATGGETIVLAPGEYDGFDFANNGGAARGLTLNFKGDGDVTIDCGGDNWLFLPYFTGKFENIKFTDNGVAINQQFNPLIYAHDTWNGYACDLEFVDCDFITTGAGNSGIHFVGDADFTRCDFVGSSSYSAMNYCCPSGDGIEITDCTFTGDYSFASIHLAEGAGADTVISGCNIATGLVEFGSPKNISFVDNQIDITVNLWSENNVVFTENEFGENALLCANNENSKIALKADNSYPEGKSATDVIATDASIKGEIEVAPFKGEGTQAAPYLINNLTELVKLAKNVNDGAYAGKYIYVKLMEDIDLEQMNWTPIGTSSNAFQGEFDGNDKIISNLCLVGNATYTGFFGQLGNNPEKPAVVKNLTIDGVEGYNLGERSAALAGTAFTAKLSNVVVKNAELSTNWAVRYVGGLVGHGYTTMDNCGFEGNITGNALQVGGLSGVASIRATGCWVKGNISGYAAVGGIIGQAQAEVNSIKGCYVEGIITANYKSWDIGNVGGIVGVACATDIEIKDNYSNTETWCYGTKLNVPVLGAYTVAIDDNTDFSKVSGNSWNKDKNPADSFEMNEVNDGNPEDLTATGARNNNLVATESDLKYLDADSVADVTIMPFAADNGVTEEDVEAAILEADTIKVRFDKLDNSLEGEHDYNIVLVANDERDINRLNSADLTFKLDEEAVTGGELAYKIIAVDNINVTPKTENRYMFSFASKDGSVTAVTPDTGKELVIGKVKVSGYGTYTLAVDNSATANETNAVHATKIHNNIVDTFIPGGKTLNSNTVGELDLNTSNTGEQTIAVPSRNLKINVTFPNAVEKSAAEYQDMKVVITGGDITPLTAENFVYDLGTNGDVDMDTDGNYVIDNVVLTKGRTYTVTVSGAGYRTFAYDVTMDNAKDSVKVLTFWNNVMDADKAVEADNEASEETVTFLAGDIVKDDNINIYDLSAVVSYFATPTAKTIADEKAQYDLNRDGMIDSKDVAYVLVSWGK